jgi:hypothetical protein
VQILLEILNEAAAGQPRIVTVAVDRLPECGDQIVLVDATGAVAYRVRRQSWRIGVRYDVYGEVTGHCVQLEPDVARSAALAAAPAAGRGS